MGALLLLHSPFHLRLEMTQASGLQMSSLLFFSVLVDNPRRAHEVDLLFTPLSERVSTRKRDEPK